MDAVELQGNSRRYRRRLTRPAAAASGHGCRAPLSSNGIPRAGRKNGRYTRSPKGHESPICLNSDSSPIR